MFMFCLLLDLPWITLLRNGMIFVKIKADNFSLLNPKHMLELATA